MPTITITSWHVPRFPKWMVALVPIGMLLVGWGLSERVSPLSAQHNGVETVTRHGTRVVTTTRTVTRSVHGHVIRQNHKVYVQVPLIVVRTDDHIIRVPAHKLPLRSAAATVADPLVTVHVVVPTTVTATETVTTTDVVPTTITVTVPIQQT